MDVENLFLCVSLDDWLSLIWQFLFKKILHTLVVDDYKVLNPLSSIRHSIHRTSIYQRDLVYPNFYAKFLMFNVQKKKLRQLLLISILYRRYRDICILLNVMYMWNISEYIPNKLKIYTYKQTLTRKNSKSHFLFRLICITAC